MSNAYYQMYRESVLELSKTLVIKSEVSAQSINNGLRALQLPVDTTAPQTWKYYLNLAGLYHYTDTPMKVISMDTLEEITFDGPTLRYHRATRKAYRYGTLQYKELVRRYPEQEQLILGVLNPVDINTAIKARDGQILWIDQNLIEENESPLVEKLQKRIDGFLIRWSVDDYGLVDDLYPAAKLAILYLQIPHWIFNIRLSHCKTEYAHSFHIRQYLTGNGRLDVFFDSLSKKQMLFLYRNIKYIHRNAGKTDTFTWLVKNILTDRGIPLAEYDIRHNLEELTETLLPKGELRRKSLNGIASAGAKENRTVVDILNREQVLARDNAKVQPEAELEIRKQITYALTPNLKTKVLESAIIDRTDAVPFTLTDTLLNNWIYLSTHNLYPAILNVPDPKTGGPKLFTTRDAFIAFLYCFNKPRGFTLPYVPNIEACRILKPTTPNRTDLLGLVEREYVPEYIVDYALDLVIPIRSTISTEAFYDFCVEHQRMQMLHRDLYALREHMVTRGQVEAMVGHLYCDYVCNLANEISYPQWFTEKGLEIDEYTNLELNSLAMELLRAATGQNVTASKSLKDLQTSLLRLMSQLSSYSIHYIQEINSGPIKITDWSAMRLGDELVWGSDRIKTDALNQRIQALHAKGKGKFRSDLARQANTFKPKGLHKHRVCLDMGMDWSLRGTFGVNVHGTMPSVYVDSKEE